MTREEFTRAVERNNQRLFLIALSYTHSPADSEDILQNVFLKLWNYQRPFENSVHLGKWLTCVTVNESKNYLRSPFRSWSAPLEDMAETFRFDSGRDLDLFRAVMALPKNQSAVLHLFYYEELSVEEIASLLRITCPAVKTRLCRARKKLREMLGDEWNEE